VAIGVPLQPPGSLSEAKLKPLRQMDKSGINQVMATHSPMLMAYPGARLLRLSKYGLDPVTVEDTEHFRRHAGVLERAGGTHPDDNE
jgi:predicted ATPase